MSKVWTPFRFLYCFAAQTALSKLWTAPCYGPAMLSIFLNKAWEPLFYLAAGIGWWRSSQILSGVLQGASLDLIDTGTDQILVPCFKVTIGLDLSCVLTPYRPGYHESVPIFDSLWFQEHLRRRVGFRFKIFKKISRSELKKF
ncbi:MAG: hypothetical protein ACRYHA_09565 [Janthinobacterium lividum]